MKIILLILFLLTACSNNSKQVKQNYNFNKDMSFEEFKLLLIDYSKNSTYPDIDD